jgi:hypothetical protein
MNKSAVASRPLQILAGLLGIAIAVLFVAWVQIEPHVNVDAPPAPAPSRDSSPAVPATAARDADATREGAPATSQGADAANLAANAAVMFGTVKRADGTPVTDGVTWLYRDGKHVGTAGLRRGAFAFAGLQPGVHRLTSRIPDELAIEREVTVTAPQTRLDIELAPKWLLTVNATTPDGKPLREATPALGFGSRSLRALAFALPLDGDLVSSRSSEFEAGLGPFRPNDPIFGRDNAKALPKETLGVLALPPDQPVHVALLLGGTLIAQQPATPGQEKVEFVLAADAIAGKTSTVTFRCLDPSGAPVVGAHVSMGSGSGRTMGEKAVTDAEGRYTAKNVLPGRVDFGVWTKELPSISATSRCGPESSSRSRSPVRAEAAVRPRIGSTRRASRARPTSISASRAGPPRRLRCIRGAMCCSAAAGTASRCSSSTPTRCRRSRCVCRGARVHRCASTAPDSRRS